MCSNDVVTAISFFYLVCCALVAVMDWEEEELLEEEGPDVEAISTALEICEPS